MAWAVSSPKQTAWARTQQAYGVLGDLASLTDAEGQVTRYEYDGLGRQARIIWPDHVASSVLGDADYGITETAYDMLGRVSRCDSDA